MVCHRRWVGGWVGGVGGWVGSRRQVKHSIGTASVWSSNYIWVPKVPAIGPNVLEWRVRDVSPSPGRISDLALHVVPHGSHAGIVSVMSYRVGKTRSRKADQSTKPGNCTVYV